LQQLRRRPVVEETRQWVVAPGKVTGEDQHDGGDVQSRNDAEAVCAKLANRALGARALQQQETTLQLSECDQEVLVLLPSLLSLEGIAEDLSISVNTVKARLRAVYLNLGVTSRRAAVVAAHGREHAHEWPLCGALTERPLAVIAALGASRMATTCSPRFWHSARRPCS
jgi:DNA-binding CsgD family transcriptional regulator